MVTLYITMFTDHLSYVVWCCFAVFKEIEEMNGSFLKDSNREDSIGEEEIINVSEDVVKETDDSSLDSDDVLNEIEDVAEVEDNSDISSEEETFLGFENDEDSEESNSFNAQRQSSRIKRKKKLFTYHEIGGKPLME